MHLSKFHNKAGDWRFFFVEAWKKKPFRFWGVQIFAHTPKWNSDVCSHPKMGGLAWEGAVVARPWPGLQMPGLCNTRSTSSRKACNPDVYIYWSHRKGECR